MGAVVKAAPVLGAETEGRGRPLTRLSPSRPALLSTYVLGQAVSLHLYQACCGPDCKFTALP